MGSGKSCGLNLLSSSNTGSLISFVPGAVPYADVSPPRSDLSRYAPGFCRFAYPGFLLRLITLPNELELLFQAF